MLYKAPWAALCLKMLFLPNFTLFLYIGAIFLKSVFSEPLHEDIIALPFEFFYR